MKRCPQCYQLYGNMETYCEADGQRLLPDPGLTVDARELVPDAPPMSRRNRGVFATGLVGVFTGVFLCGSAYLAYSYFSSTSDKESERPPLAVQVHEPTQTQPAPARAPEAVPSPSESPTEEEAEASPEPSQQPQVEPAAARLDNGPVSTGDHASAVGDGAKAKTIIEMTDGSMVEVDAAWKDNQGVWYRQGSLVSFVEGPRVKAITARAEPKASPAGNQ